MNVFFCKNYGSLWRAAGREAPHVLTSAKGVDGMDRYLPLQVCIRCSAEVLRKGKKGWRLYCSKASTVRVEPGVYDVEWLWDLERLQSVRRTLHSPLHSLYTALLGGKIFMK